MEVTNTMNAAELVPEYLLRADQPLDAGPSTRIWVDAVTEKAREAGRIVNLAVVIATGVNAYGHREMT